MLGKNALQLTQLSALRETFHGFNAAAIRLNSEHQACAGGRPVNQHCAGPAVLGLASNVRSLQDKLMTEKICKMRAWLDSRFEAVAIDRHFDCVSPRHISLAVRPVGEHS